MHWVIKWNATQLATMLCTISITLASAIGAPNALKTQSPAHLESPLLLAPDQVEAAATVEINLSAGAFAKPWSVAPDFRVGIAPRIDLGVISSSHSLSKLGAGSGICVSGQERGCDSSYRNAAIDLRYLALSILSDNRTFQLASRARLLLRETSPLKPAFLVGALGKWRAGRFAITADPYIQFGLANQDRGNRSRVALPMWLTVAPTCGVAVSLFVAFDSEFAVIRDGWHGAAALQVAAAVTPQVTAELRAGFPSLIGPQNTFKERVVALTVTLHAP
jgi:hypothetical protein